MAQREPLGPDEEMYPAPLEQMSYEEFILFCNQPTPDHVIKWRKGPKDRNTGDYQMLKYIEWHVVADFLDKYWPWWGHYIDQVHIAGETVIIVASIKIGDVTRSGVGTGSLDNFSKDPEMGVKTADSDALKRAASKFGIGRDLYQTLADDEEEAQAQRTAPPPTTRPAATAQRPRPQAAPAQPARSPLAQNDTELASGAQIGMIKKECERRGISPDLTCRNWCGDNIDALSKYGASQFIEHIKAMPMGQPAAVVAQPQPRPVAAVAPRPVVVSAPRGGPTVVARVPVPVRRS